MITMMQLKWLFTNAIPSDFGGVMGVPISFLDKYNPYQFEILGATQRGCHDDVPDFKKYDDYWEVRQNGERTGSTGGKTNENTNISMNDGKEKLLHKIKMDILFNPPIKEYLFVINKRAKHES